MNLLSGSLSPRVFLFISSSFYFIIILGCNLTARSGLWPSLSITNGLSSLGYDLDSSLNFIFYCFFLYIIFCRNYYCLQGMVFIMISIFLFLGLYLCHYENPFQVLQKWIWELLLRREAPVNPNEAIAKWRWILMIEPAEPKQWIEDYWFQVRLTVDPLLAFSFIFLFLSFGQWKFILWIRKSHWFLNKVHILHLMDRCSFSRPIKRRIRLFVPIVSWILSGTAGRPSTVYP